MRFAVAILPAWHDLEIRRRIGARNQAHEPEA